MLTVVIPAATIVAAVPIATTRRTSRGRRMRCFKASSSEEWAVAFLKKHCLKQVPCDAGRNPQRCVPTGGFCRADSCETWPATGVAGRKAGCFTSVKPTAHADSVPARHRIAYALTVTIAGVADD